MSSSYMHIPLSSLPNKTPHPSSTFNAIGIGIGIGTGGALKPRSSSPPFVTSSSIATTRCSSSEPSVVRRSANYNPPFWDYNYIQSLTTKHTEEIHSWQHADLLEQVKVLVQRESMEVVGRLELIDELQRLGISYHFDNQIKQILNSIYKNYMIDYQEFEEEEVRRIDDDLYSTALAFRLLRDHGFRVSQDVFDCFKNENGDFRSSLGDDTRGVLQLYEASFLLTQGEETLEMANEFATKILQRKLVGDIDIDDEEEELADDIRKALELPIHWRIQRPNARCFIEAYQRSSRRKMNPILLQLAKLDFNILQSMHQQELKLVSSWWDETGLSEAMPFARDRVVECYVWTLGGLFQPQYGYYRIMATKINLLITIIDDIFDVYATCHELHLFNTAIQRWDVEAMDELPKYMQMCFLTLNNVINEMAYNVLKEQHILITQHLRHSWIDLCRTYTQEAEWYATGYKPTLDEYMSNAWISISAPLILTHAFFLITNPIQKHALHSFTFCKYHHILIHSSSIILRLANDLGTSPYEMERGDVPKSVQCYMNETGASTDEAREHVRVMIWEAWQKMNEGRVGKSPFSENFVRAAVDLGRMALYMYQHGDGHGIQNPIIKERISTLLFQPV